MRRRAVAAVVALLASAATASAQSARNVLVVANEESAASARIAEYYAKKRGIPAEQLVRLRMPISDEIDRATYARTIEAPIAAWLASHSAQDRILYIVLTKDVPLRIAGSTGPDGTVSAVDSELTLLYRRMTGRPTPLVGKVENPYFAAAAAPGAFKHFTHRVADIYLVTRLDAFTESEATAIVDRALTPAHGGKIVLDEKGTGADRVGDQWLERASELLAAVGARDVALERTTAVAPRALGVIGYYSWGSNDPAIRSRQTGMSFLPGAIAAMYVSTDARTFRAPPQEWTIGDWNTRSSYHAGSPQSLTGDLVREGVTGAAGHVAEPYLDATIRPYVLFPAYVAGFNLAEAFYQAMPYLSWQTVVVGDPLCAIGTQAAASADDLDPPIDPATELPRLLSDRKVAAASGSGGVRTAVVAYVKGEGLAERGDRAGARRAMEDALKLDPRFVAAERALALFDEAERRFDSAAARYRHIVENHPTDVVALNNLAYVVATSLSKPSEALPFAERAAALAPRQPDVLDTLGWIYHLAGDDRRADATLERARQSGASVADIWIHSAEVHLALGNAAAASRDLELAARIDPSVEKRDDVVRLRAAAKKP